MREKMRPVENFIFLLEKQKEEMLLALHGHHILIIATLAFAAAVLIPFWYTSPNLQIKRNIFQICDTTSNTCYWTILPTSNNQTIQTGKHQKDYLRKINKINYYLVLPILAASLAIACAGTSLIGLILGSWYIQRFTEENKSKWLIILTIVSVFFSCMSNCC